MRSRRLGLVALLTITLATPMASLAAEPAAGGGSEPAPSVDSAPRRFVQVIVHPLLVEYTPEFLANERRRRLRVEGKDLERMRRDYHEIVTTKLSPEFPTAAGPGPEVARVDAVLVDHEVDKRAWLAPARDVFRGAPAVQLVAYIRDSQTGEILDTVGMTLRPDPNRMMQDTPGAYWNFMRQVFDRIGIRLRWALEDGIGTL